jgi:hypothetical protein
VSTLTESSVLAALRSVARAEVTNESEPGIGDILGASPSAFAKDMSVALVLLPALKSVACAEVTNESGPGAGDVPRVALSVFAKVTVVLFTAGLCD